MADFLTLINSISTSFIIILIIAIIVQIILIAVIIKMIFKFFEMAEDINQIEQNTFDIYKLLEEKEIKTKY